MVANRVLAFTQRGVISTAHQTDYGVDRVGDAVQLKLFLAAELITSTWVFYNMPASVAIQVRAALSNSEKLWDDHGFRRRRGID